MRVDLRLPASPADLTWILNVTLNGQLVDSRRLDSPDPVVVPLPPATQLLANTLKLTVQRDRDLGGCDVRPPTSYPIQLLGTSGSSSATNPEQGSRRCPPATSPPDTPSTFPTPRVRRRSNSSTPPSPPSSPKSFPRNQILVTSGIRHLFRGTSFVVVGSSSEVATVAHVEDGRLTAGSSDNPVLDLSSFENGAVIQCATGPGASRGLSIQAVGEAGRAPLPSFGRECVNVATPRRHLLARRRRRTGFHEYTTMTTTRRDASAPSAITDHYRSVDSAPAGYAVDRPASASNGFLITFTGVSIVALCILTLLVHTGVVSKHDPVILAAGRGGNVAVPTRLFIIVFFITFAVYAYSNRWRRLCIGLSLLGKFAATCVVVDLLGWVLHELELVSLTIFTQQVISALLALAIFPHTIMRHAKLPPAGTGPSPLGHRRMHISACSSA